jgi:hypothetical protein
MNIQQMIRSGGWMEAQYNEVIQRKAWPTIFTEWNMLQEEFIYLPCQTLMRLSTQKQRDGKDSEIKVWSFAALPSQPPNFLTISGSQTCPHPPYSPI